MLNFLVWYQIKKKNQVAQKVLLNSFLCQQCPAASFSVAKFRKQYLNVCSSVFSTRSKHVPFLLIRVFKCAWLIFFMLMRMTLFLTKQHSDQPGKSRQDAGGDTGILYCQWCQRGEKVIVSSIHQNYFFCPPEFVKQFVYFLPLNKNESCEMWRTRLKGNIKFCTVSLQSVFLLQSLSWWHHRSQKDKKVWLQEK